MAKCFKFRYRDEIAAKLALATIKNQDRASRPKTERRAYSCPECRGWHLTSWRRRRAA